MIICMFKMICVTNRKLCKTDFLQRIEEIASKKISAIILREKDLTAKEYQTLAVSVFHICQKYQIPCILHSFVDVAITLKAESIHLSLEAFLNMEQSKKEQFSVIGVSCHSVQDAILAEKAGCSYVIAGHIFQTDCKKDLEPRGLTFLEEVCRSVTVPVYAIGGINDENIDLVEKAGAKGACMMSSLMNP